LALEEHGLDLGCGEFLLHGGVVLPGEFDIVSGAGR
jgi:hypothetical protein